MSTERVRVRRWLVAILLLGFVIRLGVPLVLFRGTAETRLPDEAGYLEAGRNLLAGRGLYLTDDRFDPPMHVYANRLPGYPAFVAALGGSVGAVRVVQAVLDTSTALAAFLIARRWLTGRAALLAAALVAFNPFLVYFSGLILSETLFTAMLAWGVCLLTGGRRASWVGGLALLALSVHVRPSAVLLPVTMAAALAVVSQCRGWRTSPRLPGGEETGDAPRRVLVRATVLSVAVAALLTGVALAPWALRNRLHPAVHAWVWTTTNGGMVLWDGLHPGAEGDSDQSFVRAMPELSRMSEVGQDDHLSGLARNVLLTEPGRVARLATTKVGRTWSPVPLSAEYGRPIYRLVGLAYAVPLLGLTVIGLWRPNLPWPAKVMLLTPAVYFTFVHALTVGSLRYRVPVEPLLAVVAASVARGDLRTRSDERLTRTPLGD